MDSHSSNLKIFGMILITLTCLCLIAPTPLRAASPVVDIRISSDWDDSEERISTGEIDDGSSDLELGAEGGGSGLQLVGLRFPGIPVPQGATITSAYIVFTTDETDYEVTNLSITMQDSDNPPQFTANYYDISDRPTIASAIAWNDVPLWNTVGESDYKQQSPDLTSLVQEMVDRPGWTFGNAMVFIISGTGERTAESHDGSSDKAPLLHIEYSSNELSIPVAASNDDAREAPCWGCDAGTNAYYVRLYRPMLKLPDDAEEPIGLRFQNINLEPGTIIEYAYLEFTAEDNSYGTAEWVIDGQAADSPIGFADTDSNISGRPRTGSSVNWLVSSAWYLNQKYESPDISPVIQEIIGRAGWTAGNDLVLFVNSPAERYPRYVYSYDEGIPDKAPVLHIRFGGAVIGGGDPPPPPLPGQPYITIDDKSPGSSCYEAASAPSVYFTVTNSGSSNLNYAISISYNSGSDWMTLSPDETGRLLAEGASQQYRIDFASAGLPVGNYQAVITIFDPMAVNNPQEVTVGLSVLQPPQADVASCGNVPVYMDITTAPAVLVLLDISSSMGSDMDVASMPYPHTPNLSAIVQEIVDRPAWVSGNAMVFMLQGSGQRVTRSYEGQSGSAPLLHVEYNDGLAHLVEVRVKQGSDDAEEKPGLAVDINDDAIEMVYDGTNQTIGLRFQNVTIPQGAIITNAYIEFFPALTDSGATTLTIHGEDLDNPPTFSTSIGNISNRGQTLAAVSWSIPEWTGVIRQSRMEIGKEVIAELVKDRSINWGYGNWCYKYEWSEPELDYTLIQVGTKTHDDAHQAALQKAINETEKKSGTPFSLTIEGARKYFKGVKREWVYERNADGTINRSASPVGSESGDPHVPITCQQKFLIEVTDGRGYYPDDDNWFTLNPEYPASLSVDENARLATRLLAEDGVSTIAVGFGLEEDEAGQLYEVSREANIQGKLSEDDSLYALHEEDADGGVPYFAFNKAELLRALTSISDKVKGAIFTGSAPAAATSTDLGDVVIVAKFDGSRWTGDVEAIAKDIDEGSPTYGDWLDKLWVASEQMPMTRKVYTIDPAGSNVIEYTDATLSSDNWLCKEIGDIINSTPIVVGAPPYYYPFDNYYDYIRERAILTDTRRDSVVYIGANDGSLHAFDLLTGAEKWAFVPKSMHDKLNLAGVDSVFDMCNLGYCHQYFVDGSPQAGDVFANFGSGDEWRTILVTGLREGGTSYFALDVTTGKGFDEGSDDDKIKYLWEFSDDELGQSWSDAAIERVIVDGTDQKAWGVFMGSGYSPTSQSSKMAFLYGIQAHDAGDLWKDALGNTTNRVVMDGGLVEIIKVKNYPVADPSKLFDLGEVIKGTTSGATAKINYVEWTSSDHARIVLGNISGTFASDEHIVGLMVPTHQADLIGNVVHEEGPFMDDALASPLVVDMEADYVADRIYVGDLYGNMYRVTSIGKGQVPVTSKLFTFNNHIANKNPIRARADYAYDELDGSIWVYFGTGIYEQQIDKSNAETQYFFGLKDNAAGVPTYELSNLVQTTAEFETVNIDGQDVVVRIVSGSNPDNDSWAMILAPGAVGGERVIVKPLIIGGIVFFTTFVPDANICEGSGDTYVFAIDYNTGLPPTNPIFDLNGDGQFDGDDMVNIDGTPTVPAGIFVGRGQGSHPVLHEDTLFITTTGSGDDPNNPPSGSDPSPGGLKDFKVNISGKRVRVETWRQK